MPLPAFTVTRTRKTLTLFGWAMLAMPIALLLIGIILTVHPFLAVYQSTKGQALVVNGWLTDRDLQEAKNLFKNGNYKILIVSGGPLARGAFLSRYKSYAELGYASLIKMGLKAEQMISAPALSVQRDRTYAGALAVKEKLKEIPFKITGLDVFTEGVHSRRSRYLYQLAFGQKYEIGVLSASIQHYDPERWWAYSAGVRQTINEMIAYTYARFLFRP